jgi:hypothetical protein
MTPAERQRRHRARVKKAVASLTLEQTFRWELAAFVRTFVLFHPKIKVEEVKDALEKYGLALALDAWRKKKGKPHRGCEQRFCAAAVGETWDSFFGLLDRANADPDLIDVDFSS